MKDMIIFLIEVAIGCLIGSKIRNYKERIKWTGTLQTVSVIVLILAMGCRMGAREEVVQNLGTIGVTALFITIAVLVCTVLGLSVTRRLLGIDRYGVKIDPSAGGTQSVHKEGHAEHVGVDHFTIFLIVSVLVGMAFGYFLAGRIWSDINQFDTLMQWTIKVVLYLMMFLVGIHLGLDETVVPNIKKVGLRVFIFPFVNVAVTILVAGACALLMPISVKEGMAVGAGFGWYSLGPGIIMDAGFVTASAIAFMHSVMREILGLILTPVVAKKVGYIECTALPGAASMDSAMPIVDRCCGGTIAIYSFVAGVITHFAVPILTPILISL